MSLWVTLIQGIVLTLNPQLQLPRMDRNPCIHPGKEPRRRPSSESGNGREEQILTCQMRSHQRSSHRAKEREGHGHHHPQWGPIVVVMQSHLHFPKWTISVTGQMRRSLNAEGHHWKLLQLQLKGHLLNLLEGGWPGWVGTESGATLLPSPLSFPRIRRCCYRLWPHNPSCPKPFYESPL